nr:MAG TPA: Radical SAM superfamily [Caudoviricetes sp.]
MLFEVCASCPIGCSLFCKSQLFAEERLAFSYLSLDFFRKRFLH